MELLEKILAKENLNKAYKKVYQNKGVSGVDGITVEEIAEYIKENKDRITSKIRKRQKRIIKRNVEFYKNSSCKIPIPLIC